MKTIKLEKIGACHSAIHYVRRQKSYVDAWNNCPRGDWMLWIASKLRIDKRLLTLSKGRCAETVLHLMQDERSKDAIQAAIDYGHGLIGDEELKNAAYAAYAAYVCACADAYADATYAAYACAYADAYADASCAYAACAYAANAVAYAAVAYDAADAARKKNLQETADICRDLLTDEVFTKWNNLK